MRRPVNDAQKKALKLLATSPADAPADTTFKLSARALQTRGLATVRRVKGVWTATLTDDGRFYAEHGHYPPTAAPPDTPDDDPPSPTAGSRQPQRRPSRASAAPTPTPPAQVDSPAGIRSQGLKPRGDALRSADDPDPWDTRILISVKEAAWLLSLSEHEIRRAVKAGELDRVFIGKGTSNYRVVYGSLLAWVNDMPRQSARHTWWSRW